MCVMADFGDMHVAAAVIDMCVSCFVLLCDLCHCCPAVAHLCACAHSPCLC